MEQLVFIKNGISFTTSLKLSEIFEKRHGNLLKHIEGLKCIEGYREANYILKYYIHPKTGHTKPYYLIARDGYGSLLSYFNWELMTAYSGDFWQAFEILNEQLLTGSKHETLGLLEINITGMKVTR